jgi:hypothetical protein
MIAYVAADHGPRATLDAIAARLPGARSLGAETRLLICGTSDSAIGRAVEASARREAKARGLPCVVVEDFAGNYTPVSGGEPRLVVVDSEFAARLARSKESGVRVEITPAVRYDALRRRLAELRRDARSEDAVLWIGQPETRDSLETLQRLLPKLGGLRVWLRAHPRDAGYPGAYRALAVEDVTGAALEECLARRPRLVFTQFSSVAIEAGFWGIPSVNVLFPDLGAATLAAKKGYAVPPWCEEGAAFLVRDVGEIDAVLAAPPGPLLAAFDRVFRVREEAVPILINLLYNQGLL